MNRTPDGAFTSQSLKTWPMKNETTENPDTGEAFDFHISVIGKLSKHLIDRMALRIVAEFDHPTGITVSTLSSRLLEERAMIPILNALRVRQFPLLSVELLTIESSMRSRHFPSSN
jgi:hypothetical protein